MLYKADDSNERKLFFQLQRHIIADGLQDQE